MSSYWTEDTVTKLERTYIKGTFTGKYHAERRDETYQHHRELFDMHIYQAEVIIEEVRKNEQGDFPELVGLRPFQGSFAQPVNCYDPHSGTYFRLTIDEPRIAHPELSKITRESNEHLGTISGTLYGHLTKVQTEKVRTEHIAEDVLHSSFINDRSQWKRTATYEFSYINGIRHRRDYYSSGNSTYQWSNWYSVSSGWSLSSFLQIFWVLLFGGLLLTFLISLSWAGLLILGFFLIIFIVARIRRTSFGAIFFSAFYGLLILLYIGSIGLSIFNTATKHSVVAHSGGHPDSRDYTHTLPVRSPSPSTDKTAPPRDEWIIHHRAWADLEGNQYEGSVKVLRSYYRKSEAEHSSMSGVTGLPDVYRSMSMADGPRLDGVYALFDSLQNTRHLDSIRFASMVVSFVQDITYSSVTDGSCTDASGGKNPGLPAGYSRSCIGNIPYGVQSPVEFMANFQGDCDTRTLFLFTVLNHYHYHVAMLGSLTYRHSLLGIELPLQGVSKMAGTDRYVLWETTSTGFNAGRLSPEISNLDYWDFNLINTRTS